MFCGWFLLVNFFFWLDVVGFGEVFFLICWVVRLGNFVVFWVVLEGKREWLWERGLYLVFLYCFKFLFWRLLMRKMFLLRLGMMDDVVGGKGGEGNKVVLLVFEDVVIMVMYV